MSNISFHDYIRSAYTSKNSGTVNSYKKAIEILDEIFTQRDVFNLGNKSLTEIRDPLLIAKIINYIAEEEDKFRAGEESCFDLGRSTQTSYPRNRFCTAAIRKLGEYVNMICGDEATECMRESQLNGAKLSAKLQRQYNINERGTDREVRAKHRIGQDIFRSMLLYIYDNKCCLTGIEVPEVLRASHIIPWSANKSTRLNPQNGLCLSATYDAAFDRNLISFDEDFKLILSPRVKEVYTSEAFRTFFRNYEGKKINLPAKYPPLQEYLAKHRSNLVV